MIAVIVLLLSVLFLIVILAASMKPQRKCPHCAAFIAPEAKVCKFCGRDVDAADDAPVAS